MGACTMILSILLIAIFVGLIIYSITQCQKFFQLRNERAAVLGEKKVRNKNYSVKFTAFALKSYNFIERIPVLRRFQAKIRKKLETLAVYDEFTLRKEVMKIIFAICALVVIVLGFLLVIRPSFLVAFWVFVGFLLLSGILVDFFIYRVERKLLKQLKEYINRVRFYYQSTKMVDEAVFEAIHDAGNEMKHHAERIDKIVNSLDVEKELALYEDVAPTRYLRVFAGLAVLVKERGDKVTDGKSSFLNGLTAINKELNAEILYRSRLSYAMRNLPLLALIPIFFALPVKNWTEGSFPTTEAFYDSRIGLFSEIGVYGISIACYLILRKMREISESTKEFVPNKVKWERWILTKVKGAMLLCKAFTPKKYSRRYNDTEQLIKDANESITVYELTLQKIVSAVIIFILAFGVFAYSHVREKSVALQGSFDGSIFTETYTAKESALLQQQTDYDREVIENISKAKVLPTEEEIVLAIADQLELDPSDEEVLKTYNRIMDKYVKYSNAYLKWYEVLLAIIFAYIAYQLPAIILGFKKRARLKLMEREVYQLLMLISILKDFDGMSVAGILQWLERFSIAFKRSLEIAIEEFDSGPEEALEKLGETNTFEPFVQIVERLKLTLIRLSIAEAFEDIDVEREYYLEERKEDQTREIAEKTQMGSFLGLAPMISLIFIYLIFPIIYIAVTNSNQMMELLH